MRRSTVTTADEGSDDEGDGQSPSTDEDSTSTVTMPGDTAVVAPAPSTTTTTTAPDGDGGGGDSGMDHETKIRLIVGGLVALASLVFALTVAYWFHTRPPRPGAGDERAGDELTGDELTGDELTGEGAGPEGRGPRHALDPRRAEAAPTAAPTPAVEPPIGRPGRPAAGPPTEPTPVAEVLAGPAPIVTLEDLGGEASASSPTADGDTVTGDA